MTRKHFDALAAAMLRERGAALAVQDHRVEAQWERDVNGLADVCARFNPNFDRARFLKACGVEEAK